MKLLFIIIVTLASNTSFSQESIGILVLEKVNKLRDSLHLNKLKYDRTLEEAGIDHSYYMADKKVLNHFQTTFSKETPSERVLYYNGNRTYVGENIASTPVKWKNKGVFDDTLIAESLFKSWLNSPPHYKNMTHTDYTKMGLGKWTSSEKILYSAQVFSSNEIILPQAFNNSELSWGVRPSEFTCKDEPQTYETMFFANSVEVSGHSVYLYFHDLDFFKKVIQNDNDGLAIDVILREQLPCNKENQFHVSKVYDGEMQRPIYKHDIFRNNISDNPKKIRVKIGEVPSYLRNQQWEANVIIINDNKLCDYSYPVKVPSSVIPLLHFSPYFEGNDTNIENIETSKIHIHDSIHIELSYERSKGRFSSLNEDGMFKLINWGNFINQIDVNCYASVEGAKWYNLQLLEKRESSVLELLLQANYDLSKVNISKAENWSMMNSQISEHSLAQLESKNESQLKYWIKKNKSPFLDSLLFSQRKTHIRAVFDTIIEVNTYDNYLFASSYASNFKFDDLPWNKILRENHILKDEEIDPNIIDSLYSNPRLKTNLLGASSIGKTPGFIDSITMLNLLQEVNTKSARQVFNYANLVTRYWYFKYAWGYRTKGIATTLSPNDLRELVNKVDSSQIRPQDLARLNVNILLAGIHYYVAHNNWQPVEQYFDAIVELVKAEDFSSEEAEELALFCNHFHKFEQAVEILHPFHQENKLSEDGYFYLAQTSTLIREQLNKEDYYNYMGSAKKANHSRYCKWLNDSFQIQRDEYIKSDFCSECH